MMGNNDKRDRGRRAKRREEKRTRGEKKDDNGMIGGPTIATRKGGKGRDGEAEAIGDYRRQERWAWGLDAGRGRRAEQQRRDALEVEKRR